MPSGIKITKEQFCELFKTVHPDLELLDEYTKMKDCILRVKDKLGIIYHIRPQDLLEGKKPTITCAKDKNKAFEIKARNVHGDTYDYDKVNYTTARKHVIVSCKIHNDFSVVPDCHLNRGHGCPECGKIKSKESNKYKPMGWSKSSWDNSARLSNEFDSFKMYIIECYNDTETFIKIGRTYHKVKNRFEDKNKMPYSWKVLYIKEGDANEIFDLEHQTKKLLEGYKYMPTLHFPGKHECFSNEINMSNLISDIEKLNTNKNSNQDIKLFYKSQLSTKQQYFLDYFKTNNGWHSAKSINLLYHKNVLKTGSGNNSTGSTICKKLLTMGLLEVSSAGLYKFKVSN